MKSACTLVLLSVACLALPLCAQEKPLVAGPALEKELFAVEQQWLKAEFDKNMPKLDELWTDQFFDLLYNGQVVNKHEMMDRMAKTDRPPGTGAFPDDFKIRAIYGNVVLATDHTILKGLDANGKIVVTRDMRVLRMFVRENGKWRVAGAALLSVPPDK